MLNFTSGRRGFIDLPINTQEFVHKGIYCDVCSESIKGIRYKCSTCPDHDVCTNCIETFEAENNSHIFYRIAKSHVSSSPILQNRSTWTHAVACDNCGQNIVGYRYFCTVCATSLCEKCEQCNYHNATHNLLKMTPPQVKENS